VAAAVVVVGKEEEEEEEEAEVVFGWRFSIQVRKSPRELAFFSQNLLLRPV
jgi:hypothetical protein